MLKDIITKSQNHEAHSLVTLQVPSRELDTKTEIELPDVVNRPVIQDLCSDEQCNKECKLPESSVSNKLQSN